MLQGLSVSVIIPTYNRLAETIRAVESVLAQTVLPLEIIVVDDGSDEKSISGLTQFLNSSPICSLIHVPHTGNPGQARNLGSGQAIGNLLAFLDSDDYWLPHKLENQLEIIGSTGARFVACDSYVNNVTSNKQLIEFRKSRIVKLRNLLRRNIIATSSVVIDKDLFDSVGGFEDNSFFVGVEDYITWLKLLTKSSMYFDCRPLIVYSSNSFDSLSSRISKSDTFIFEKAHIGFLLWSKEALLRRTFFSRITLFFLRFSLWADFRFRRDFKN